MTMVYCPIFMDIRVVYTKKLWCSENKAEVNVALFYASEI